MDNLESILNTKKSHVFKRVGQCLTCKANKPQIERSPHNKLLSYLNNQQKLRRN